MKLARALVIGVSLSLLVLFAGTVQSDEATKRAKKSDAATAKQKSEQKSDSKKPRLKLRRKQGRRLPNHFGKLKLTPEQRKEIDDIQAGYKKQLDELIRQMRELKTAQQKDVQAVLTKAQKKELDGHVEEARQRRAQPKKPGAKPVKTAEKKKPKKKKRGDDE
jgi:hypothetical protein